MLQLVPIECPHWNEAAAASQKGLGKQNPWACGMQHSPWPAYSSEDRWLKMCKHRLLEITALTLPVITVLLLPCTLHLLAF